MAKTNRCVVRNETYRRDSVGNMERHNERKNEHYGNGDVDISRSALNVHFKECDSTYLQAFDRMVGDGSISMWNAKKDPKIIDEMIFDVNTEYFERGGGYEYARQFFEEAYRLAVEIAGDERYILSAVMHADERNKALSEQLGGDVYHYHLHVVYIPVVDAEIKWTKRCKDPVLVGTVKEVIKQVSNSKKWKSEQVIGKDGKKRLVYSYSLLQDRYYEHMRAAGFTGFERGERGSTAEHLDMLDFKIQQDSKRLDGIQQDIQSKQKQSDTLNKRLAVKQKTAVTYHDIDGLARRSKTGKMILEPDDWETVSGLAKTGILAKVNADEMKKGLDSTMDQLGKERSAYNRLYDKARPYLDAVKVAPEQTRIALDGILQQHREHNQQKQHRSSSLSR